MYNWLKDALLRFLRVPPEPDDPLGAGESRLVFRAAPNYFRYKLIIWAFSQLVFVPSMLIGGGAMLIGVMHIEDQIGRTLIFLLGLAFVLPGLIQIPFTYMVVRLDYEMRWYKVTDKTLRIREGVLNVREMTMTFANIQNISITQGPIQHLLGIADLKVQSAGGGGQSNPGDKHQGFGLSMHDGFFRGVDNAQQIREIMRERLKAARDSGLGDPDEEIHRIATAPTNNPAPEVIEVLRGLQKETAGFRRAAELVAARL